MRATLGSASHISVSCGMVQELWRDWGKGRLTIALFIVWRKYVTGFPVQDTSPRRGDNSVTFIIAPISGRILKEITLKALWQLANSKVDHSATQSIFNMYNTRQVYESLGWLTVQKGIMVCTKYNKILYKIDVLFKLVLHF